MATLKLMVWNMEWMNDLFTADFKFKPDNAIAFHTPGSTVLQRRKGLAKIIIELNPDILVGVEAPNDPAEWQLFLDTDLPGKWVGHIQKSPGMSQCLGIAVRTDTGKFAAQPFTAFDTLLMNAFNEWRMDLEDDGISEVYRFERSPLYASVMAADGKEVRIMGLHLKSKLVASALEWSKWWENADANRRKIFAQASRIRQQFLDEYLADTATQDIPIIVCGDINDGPGMDASERKILGSGIERLMGNVWFPKLTMGNALFDSLSLKDQKAMRFEKIVTTSYRDMLFNNMYHDEWIDHILYSRQYANWVINAVAHKKLAEGFIYETPYKHSSDHYPLTADVVL